MDQLHVTYLMFLTAIAATMSLLSHGAPPSPGYFPSRNFREVSFDYGYRNLWGPQHQRLDQNILTLWLDRSSGSGFKSRNMYRKGYFGANIKLQPGYTAGVITSFYLSNNEDFPGHHDEIDIEFLGTIPGKPYTLQTNVYIKGSGDGYIIGREMRFHLWFDPTEDFHYYAILWTPAEIIFFVDDVPIRRYPRKSDATFPLRPMYMYGSVWDASSWATENGKYKADYNYQPFVGKYKDFKIGGCTTTSPSPCRSPSVAPSGSYGLSHQQLAALLSVQKNYMVYDYCNDHSRDRSQIPEC